MVDMLVEQNSRNIGPLTPVSSPGGGSNSSRQNHHHHHNHQHHIHLHHSTSQATSNLSPQTSSASSTASCTSNSSSSGTSDTSSPMRDDRSQCTPVKEEREEEEEEEEDQAVVNERGANKGEEKFSALQRLQFALEKNTLFSGLYTNGQGNKEEILSEKKGKTDFGEFGGRRIRRANKMLSMGTPQSSDDEGSGVVVGGGGPMMAEDYSRSDEDEDMMMVASPEENDNGAGSVNGNNAGNIFECPLCSVTCNSRHQFNEHLVSHSQQHACPKCSFLTNDEEALRSHLQDAHDIQSPEGAVADDDVSSPRINSQGKVKTFKCKQCEFKTDTKLKFWEHSKSHIRQEKMLTCPKCPFVTEYKHHLEYHLRNHFGSKPFQCTKCSYSCVNKSMLNSHLKSHSNVYQYRCADCSYATKYCHSLKLHLRKYSHNPSMVLNLDGTPNPLPIIDVYGTRRGPKVKRSSDGSQVQQQTDVIVTKSPPNSTMMIKNELKKRCHSNNNSRNDGKHSPKLVTMKREESTPPPTMAPARKYNVQPPATAGSDSDDTCGPFSKQQHSYRMPETPVTPGNLGAFTQSRPEHHHNHHHHQIQAAAAAAAAAAAVAGKNPLEFYAALNQYILASNLPLIHMVPNLAKEQQSQILNHILTNQQQQQSMAHQVPSSPQAAALASPRSPFLSSPVAPPDENQFAALDLRNPKSSMSNYTQVDEKRAKRKGKAVRYDRKMILTQEPDDDDEDEDQVIDFSNNNNNNNRISKSAADLNSMRCKYCEISFPVPLLYTMHMSYHTGDSDPWLCKSCGKRTKDKVAFSIHLTQDSH